MAVKVIRRVLLSRGQGMTYEYYAVEHTTQPGVGHEVESREQATLIVQFVLAEHAGWKGEEDSAPSAAGPSSSSSSHETTEVANSFQTVTDHPPWPEDLSALNLSSRAADSSPWWQACNYLAAVGRRHFITPVKFLGWEERDDDDDSEPDSDDDANSWGWATERIFDPNQLALICAVAFHLGKHTPASVFTLYQPMALRVLFRATVIQRAFEKVAVDFPRDLLDIVASYDPAYLPWLCPTK